MLRFDYEKIFKNNRIYGRLGMLAAIFPAAYAPNAMAVQSDGVFEYHVTNGEVTITAFVGSHPYIIGVPETVLGLPVTAIGSWAFADTVLLEKITLPDSVRRTRIFKLQ